MEGQLYPMLDSYRVLKILEEIQEKKEPLGDQSKVLDSVLGWAYLNGLRKIQVSCSSDEIFSGDPILEPSKPTLSVACLTSCLGELGKSIRKNLSLGKSPDPEEAKASLSGVKPIELEDKYLEIFEKHKKTFDKVFADVVKASEANLEKTLANPNLDPNSKLANTDSASLAILVVLEALSNVEKSAPDKSNAKKEEQNLFIKPSDEVLSLLEKMLLVEGDEGESLPWAKGAMAVKKELDNRYGDNLKVVRGVLYRIYKRAKDPEKIKTLKKVLDMYRVASEKKSGQKKSNPKDQASSDSKAATVTGVGSIAANVGSLFLTGTAKEAAAGAGTGMALASCYLEGRASVHDPAAIEKANTFSEKHPVISEALRGAGVGAAVGAAVVGAGLIGGTIVAPIGIALGLGAAISGVAGTLLGTSFGSAYALGRRSGRKKEIASAVY